VFVGNIFRGTVFPFLDAATDLVLLNLVWLLCCVPVVTIGASSTAMYTVLFRMIRGESSHPILEFFRAFRRDFKKSTCMTLLFLAVFLILALDYWIVHRFESVFGKLPVYVLSVLTMLLVMMALYSFPLNAYYTDPVPVLCRNSLLMSLRYFPSTILILLTSAAPLAFALWLLEVTHVGVYAWFVIGGALSARINCRFFLRIFQNHLPHQEKEDS